MEEIFNKWQSRCRLIQHLAGIVQNEGYTPNKEQLLEWISEANGNITALEGLVQETVQFFLPLLGGE